MGDTIKPPTPTPRMSSEKACEYVTLYGKRDFASVIKDLGTKGLSQVISDDPGRPKVITRVLERKQEGQC